MRRFQIYFKEHQKYGNPIVRNVVVTPSIRRNIPEENAKAALNVFMSTVGNLKEYEIIKIQEIDDAGAAIGEPICPE